MCHLGGKQTQYPYMLKKQKKKKKNKQIFILSFTCGLHKQNWDELTEQMDQILLASWINLTLVSRDTASCHHFIPVTTKQNIVEISNGSIPSFREHIFASWYTCSFFSPPFASPFYQTLTVAEGWSPEGVRDWIFLKKGNVFPST